MKTILSLCLTLCVSYSLPLPAAVTAERLPAPNLVRNGDFSSLGADGLPEEWFFENCSNTEQMLPSTGVEADGNRYAAASGPGEAFGYFLQAVAPLEPGKSYCVGLDLRAYGSRANLWLTCGSLVKMVGAYPEHGAELAAILENFIDPAAVRAVDSVKWSRYHAIFTVPEDASELYLRFGLYDGLEGWIHADNAYCGELTESIRVTVTGKGFSRLAVRTLGGAPIAELELNPEEEEQHFTVSSAFPQEPLRLFLTDSDGKTIPEEIPCAI